MTRAAFITFNRWTGRIPCPICLPGATTSSTPPPSNLRGVMRILGEVNKTGKRLYVCFSCNYEVEK